MFLLTLKDNKDDGAYDELAIKTCKYHSYKYAIITPNDIVIPPKND
jgi:hypothetical protein